MLAIKKIGEMGVLLWQGAINIQNTSKSPGSSIGRAKHWSCLGYKFKSYLGHT
jgi:hypothetical protein